VKRGGSAVDELLKGALAAGLVPSAVAMWGRGPDIRESIRVGRPRLGPSTVDVTGDIWYDLASLTKPLVTGTLTLLAFRDLGLQPDAVVGTLLDGVGHRPIADVTINQLLSHSSGLPAWEPVYALATSPAEVVEAIAAIELQARPGARVEYSCLGFILLGKILEDLFGEPLDACFRRHVLEPLGLEEMLAFRPDPTARSVAGGSATASPEIVGPVWNRRRRVPAGFRIPEPRHGPSQAARDRRGHDPGGGGRTPGPWAWLAALPHAGLLGRPGTRGWSIRPRGFHRHLGVGRSGPRVRLRAAGESLPPPLPGRRSPSPPPQIPFSGRRRSPLNDLNWPVIRSPGEKVV